MTDTDPTPVVDVMPEFPLLAKDELAVDVIKYYRMCCESAGYLNQAAEVEKAIAEFNGWRERHPDKVKRPDHEHVPAGLRKPSRWQQLDVTAGEVTGRE
ncbi:MAG TPA: hypothetical protein VF516_12365 [Kofleriaceae bacterium]